MTSPLQEFQGLTRDKKKKHCDNFYPHQTTTWEKFLVMPLKERNNILYIFSTEVSLPSYKQTKKDALKYVIYAEIPEGATEFYFDGSNIAFLIFPESLWNILLVKNFPNLEMVIIFNTNAMIKQYAFASCTSLTTVRWYYGANYEIKASSMPEMTIMENFKQTEKDRMIGYFSHIRSVEDITSSCINGFWNFKFEKYFFM